MKRRVEVRDLPLAIWRKRNREYEQHGTNSPARVFCAFLCMKERAKESSGHERISGNARLNG